MQNKQQAVSERLSMLEHMFEQAAVGFWKLRRRWRYPRRRGPGLHQVGGVTDAEPSSIFGRGIYTVRETVHILRPSLTPRKVHYWLDEGILAEPIRWGHRGIPTLLTYNQVMHIRVLQRLRDDLKFSLRKSRNALEWVTQHVTAQEWTKLTFFRTGAGEVGITDGYDSFGIPHGQRLLEGVLPELERFLEDTRKAWERKILPIDGYDLLVSDPRVMAGSPVIAGTRIETTFIAHLSPEVDMRDLRKMYPHVPEGGFEQAAKFEDTVLVTA